MTVMDTVKITSSIIKLYEKYLLKDASAFSIKDYNNFEEEMWELREKFNYGDSPFRLLPDPARDADWFMMNASSDGFKEPSLKDKIKYLSLMKESYEKMRNSLGWG